MHGSVTNGIEVHPIGTASTLACHRVSFVLPAYNEEPNIERAIEQIVSVAARFCVEYEVIVVDDGSHDRTAELVADIAVRDPRVRLVRHEVNRGYGDALHSGFSAARLEYVFFTDADNQFDVNEIAALLEWADDADVVAGYRKQRRDPLLRRLNAWGWNRLVRALFCVPIRDVDCAFKLFRREALENIVIDSRGAMINTEIIVKLARAGNTVVEVGVTHLPRTAGTASGANLRVIARAFREVVRMYPALAPLAPDAGNHPHHRRHVSSSGVTAIHSAST